MFQGIFYMGVQYVMRTRRFLDCPPETFAEERFPCLGVIKSLPPVAFRREYGGQKGTGLFQGSVKHQVQLEQVKPAIDGYERLCEAVIPPHQGRYFLMHLLQVE